MSQSSRRVGLVAGRGIIESADRRYCAETGPMNQLHWTTDDLADYAQGIIEAAVLSLADLRPENVTRVRQKQGVHLLVHQMIDLSQ